MTAGQQLKWQRDRGYEAIAHQRMRAAAEAVGPEMARRLLPDHKPLGYSLGGLYESGNMELAALVGREPVSPISAPEPDMRWHISINGGDRLPTWHEMVECAHQIRPGVVFVVGVPPRSWWMVEVSSGKFVLHLWELKDPALEASWMAQRTPGGRAPS